MHTSNSPRAITVNGEVVADIVPVTISALLAARGLTGKRVAVERNGEIVPRGAHGQTLLAEGDRIEIVVAVGGG